MTYEEIIEKQDDSVTCLSEPVAKNLLLLRKRVIELVSQTTDESELNRCISVLEEHKVENNRSDITRAISGEEVMNRLRPRLKSLFS